MDLKVCCISPELTGLTPSRIEDLIRNYLDHDIILFPEYLGEICPVPPAPFRDRVVVYGSRIDAGANRVDCAVDGRILTGSKLRLTPWEGGLTPGREILSFGFRGVQCAVLLCFDVEFPELAVALKQAGTELLFVPAATDENTGYFRVARCAGARAVELGCAVVTCHLIGQTDNPLIDVNVGAHNLFLPSQSLFPKAPEIKPPLDRGPHITSFTVPIDLLREQKTRTDETNPANEP